MEHAPDGIQPHALFVCRVRIDTVAGDELPASLSIRRLVVVPLVRRVWSPGARGRGGGWLKPMTPFFSLLHVKMQESPPGFSILDSVPGFFILFMVLIFVI